MNITPLDLTGTPFADVRFALCTITPVQAAEYLKRNTKNRKVKPNTVEAYTTDIRNNAWLLNWRNYGWIEPCGLEWKKTDKFGQL